jgi:hypothetical protein
VRRLAVTALAVTAAVTLAGGGAAALVRKATIVPNRGASTVRLGMTRAQVVALLGKPIYQNKNGYMQYGSNTGAPLFDIYLDTQSAPRRVRLFGISGEGFCFPGGPCMFKSGGVGKLKARFGTKLKVATLEDGERVYRLTGTYRGCSTFTDVTPSRFRPSGRLIMVFVGFRSGSACS